MLAGCADKPPRRRPRGGGRIQRDQRPGRAHQPGILCHQRRARHGHPAPAGGGLHLRAAARWRASTSTTCWPTSRRRWRCSTTCCRRNPRRAGDSLHAPRGQQHGRRRRRVRRRHRLGLAGPRHRRRHDAGHLGHARTAPTCSCPCSARPARATPPASAPTSASTRSPGSATAWRSPRSTGRATALNAIDTRAGLLDTLDKIKQQALDPYATIRSLYQQHRQSQIESARSDERATVPAWFAQPARP